MKQFRHGDQTISLEIPGGMVMKAKRQIRQLAENVGRRQVIEYLR